MKVNRSSIPEEGKVCRFVLEAARQARLLEAVGPQTGTVDVELRLMLRLNTVEVRGHYAGSLDVPCTRCLDAQPVAVDETLDVVLAPASHLASQQGARHEELQLSSSDLDVSYYEGEELDLAALVEDDLLLIADETVVEENEEGRCTACGRTEEEVLGEVEHDPEQHPFSAMKSLLSGQDS